MTSRRKFITNYVGRWRGKHWCLFSFSLTIGFWNISGGFRIFGRGCDLCIGWMRVWEVV